MDIGHGSIKATNQKNYIMPEIAEIRKMLKTTMTESPLKMESIQ